MTQRGVANGKEGRREEKEEEEQEEEGVCCRRHTGRGGSRRAKRASFTAPRAAPAPPRVHVLLRGDICAVAFAGSPTPGRAARVLSSPQLAKRRFVIYFAVNRTGQQKTSVTSLTRSVLWDVCAWISYARGVYLENFTKQFSIGTVLPTLFHVFSSEILSWQNQISFLQTQLCNEFICREFFLSRRKEKMKSHSRLLNIRFEKVLRSIAYGKLSILICITFPFSHSQELKWTLLC